MTLPFHTHITPFYKLPEGYRRTFVFRSGCASAVILATESGFHLSSDWSGLERLPEYLQWCQEVEESIKTEIGMLPDKAA